ncbi:MAG: hypothetical protein K9W43_14060 [Candidatus Thorarchaeota archaeon]|nr:hypothetical protein [Candidatus Thorarchaeota archaeon]
MDMTSLKEILEEAREKGYRLSISTVSRYFAGTRYIHHVGDDYVAVSKHSGEPYEELFPFAQIVAVEVKKPKK